MPTQRKTLTRSASWKKGSPRLRRSTPESNVALSRKYNEPASIASAISTTVPLAAGAASPSAPGCPRPARAVSSRLPVMPIVTAAMVGLAMRLVQRLEVRSEPMKASPATATAAAAGPSISSSRKMKTSLATKDCRVPGIRTGKSPASIARPMPAATCNHTRGGSCASCTR